MRIVTRGKSTDFVKLVVYPTTPNKYTGSLAGNSLINW